MKILVTGAMGQLGKAIIEQENRDSEIIGFGREDDETGGTIGMDIANLESVNRIISEVSPDLVINSAALTDVDRCERNPELAEKINFRGAENVAIACSRVGCKMIQISTDYVFDGESGDYTEEDPVNPIQEYGRSKLKGEMAVSEILGNDVKVIRTSVVFGNSSSNFVTWIIGRLKDGENLRIVDDQWVSPTSTKFLASSILAIAELPFGGVLNIASSKKISRIDMAYHIAEIFGLDSELISPTTMKEIEWGAPRPMDSSLTCSKFGKIGNVADFERMVEIEFLN
tara:strand:- start:8 stop:862 length:855 start_codon:yes stop_codon:yes gene_type:complete